MRSLRPPLLALFLLPFGTVHSALALVENFDTLEPRNIVGQSGWHDNSKLGEAQIIGDSSLSTPNHLALWEGGAIHHALDLTQSYDGERFMLKFSARRNSDQSGSNLQITLRSDSGPLLFLNLRGSGRSIDLGESSDTLVEHPFSSELPHGEWFHVEAIWHRSSHQIEVRVTSSNEAIEHLNERLELPFHAPTRLILGSTSRVKSGEWAVDDLSVQLAE